MDRSRSPFGAAFRALGSCLGMASLVASLTSCGNWLPSAGPSVNEVYAGMRSPSTGENRFALIDVSPVVVAKMETWAPASLQGTFGQQRPFSGQVIGVGDYVQVMVWEAAAGGLFSASAMQIGGGAGSRTATIPEQVVGPDGAITVPYAGRVRVVNRTPQQIEEAIVAALQGKAIEPQALVTVTKNIANTVTVVSETTGGNRVPLTTRGDRILDVIATAGGTKAPPHETFVTLVRDGRSLRIPMQAILSDPNENVFVRPGDTVSIAREVQTFTAAGATGTTAVVPFEAMGITLDQAIARAGGINDNRANPEGVFVIRYERPQDYDQLGLVRPEAGPLNQIPTIYRLNMRDPVGFFLARRFPIRNKDILYVSNAPSMEIQKFLTIMLPFLGVGATAVTVSAATR